jgi:hypothetical protein
MAKTTRHIGMCAACTRQIKVRDGRLVHHGYRRPGFGHIVGDCRGVHYPPHELSPKLAEELLDEEHRAKVSLERRIAGLPQLTELRVQKYDYRKREHYMVTFVKGEVDPHEWRQEFQQYSHELQRALDRAEYEIARLTPMVEDWRAVPLRTVQEEQAEKQEQQEARRAERQAAREQKMAEAVVKYQKRIDAAVRRHNTSTLADIYRSASEKLPDMSGYDRHLREHGISQEQALALLDRDHVWRAFGLLTADGYVVRKLHPDERYYTYSRDEKDLFDRMRWKREPWPGEL